MADTSPHALEEPQVLHPTRERFRPRRGLVAILVEPVRQSSVLVSPSQHFAERQEADPSFEGKVPAAGELDQPKAVSVEYMDDHPRERRAAIGTVVALGFPERALTGKGTIAFFEKHSDGTERRVRQPIPGRVYGTREVPPDFAVGDVVLYRQGAGILGWSRKASHEAAVRFGYPPHRQVVVCWVHEVEAVVEDGIPEPGRVR